MHDHDLDLIAAYAERVLGGDADPSDPAARLVDTCAECRTEYDDQRTVLALLEGAAPASLTEFERARLHRGLDAAVTPPARAGRWLRWVPATAVAVVALAFIGVGGLLNLGSGDTASDAFDIAAESTADTMATLAVTEPTEAAMDAAAGAAPAADDGGSFYFRADGGMTPIADIGSVSESELDMLLGDGLIRQQALTEDAGNALGAARSAWTIADLECLDDGVQALREEPTFIGLGDIEGTAFELYATERDSIVLEPPACDVVRPSGE